MSSPEVEEIKTRVSIVDVIGEYVPLKKVGSNFRARCPFHSEKSPSFYVSPARQIWHCFGCSLGGDIFEFIKQMEGVDFRQALEKLALRAGVVLPAYAAKNPPEPDRKQVLYELNRLAAKFYHQVLLQSGKSLEAREYLKKRKFRPETIAAWQLGYAPDMWDALYGFLKKRGYAESDMVEAGLVVRRDSGGCFDRFHGRITFPIQDAAGRVVGFSARILIPKEGTGKYINSPESPIYNKSQVLYGFYQARTAIRQADLVVVVEGNVDVIKSQQAGVSNVVASSGTALTEPQMLRLRNFTRNLTFAFDADAAGVAAALRTSLDAALSLDFEVRVTKGVSGFKDADELIDHDPQLWRQTIDSAQNVLDFYFDQYFGILDKSNAYAKEKAVTGFLAHLVKVPHQIVRSHYVHKVAEMFAMRDAEIAKHLVRPAESRFPPQAAAGSGQTAVKPGAAYALELHFLGQLIKAPADRFAHYRSRHTPEHFSEAASRELFAAISEEDFFGEADLPRLFQKHPGLKPIVEQALFALEIGKQTESEGALTDKNELRQLSKRLILTHLHRLKDELAFSVAEAEKRGYLEEKLKRAAEYNQVIQKIGEAEGRGE